MQRYMKDTEAIFEWGGNPWCGIRISSPSS